MTGWRIFVHSVRMVVDNLGTALRLSLVLYLVQVAGAVLLLSALTDHKHKVVLVEQV